MNYRIARLSPLPLALLIAVLLSALASVPAQTITDPGTPPQQTTAATPLKSGKQIERELIGNKAQSYTIELKQGEFFRAVAESQDVDVIVTIYSPDGEKLVAVDLLKYPSPEPVSLEAERTGTYRLEVKADAPGHFAGRYVLKSEIRAHATTQDKDRLAAEQSLVEARRLELKGGQESLQLSIRKREDALPLLRKLGDKFWEAYALHYNASVLMSLDEKKRALELYGQALSLRKEIGDRGGEASTLNNIGNIYSAQGDKQKALDFFNQALLLFRAVGDRRMEARPLYNIGKAYNELGEKRKALDHFNQVLSIVRDFEDHGREAATLYAVGLVYTNLNEPNRALDSYNQALVHYRALGDRGGEANTLYNIGRVYFNLDERRKALDFYNQALALYRALGDRGSEAGALNDIGTDFDTLGERRKALDYYNQVLPLWRALGERSFEATTLFVIGGIYNELGEHQKALDYYNQVPPLSRALGDRRHETAALLSIGIVYRELGEVQKALDYFSQALPLLLALGNSPSRAGTLSSIGSIFLLLNEKQKALDYYNMALPLLRAHSDRRQEAMMLNNIGNVYADIGDKRKALEFYNEAMSLWRAIGPCSPVRITTAPCGEARTLAHMGSVYADLGEKQKALDYLNQALAGARVVGDRRHEAMTLSKIGLVYRSLGEKQKALDSYNQALLLNQAGGDRRGEADTLYNTATEERDQGKFAEARRHFETALDIVEELRGKLTSQELRASYLSTAAQYYEHYIDLLMQMHKRRPSEGINATALQASERGRARSLIELLNEAHADIRQGVDLKLLERERSLQHLLNGKTERQIRLLSGKHTDEQAAAVAKEIESLKIDYQQVETEIKAKSPRYAALTQPQPLSAEQIQQLLDKDTLLLEYSLGDDRSYLWAVTQSSIASYELPKRSDIETAAKQFYEELTAPNQQSSTIKENRQLVRVKASPQDQLVIEAATSLSQMVVGPVASQLGKKRLLIVADGALQYIPFGALTVPVRNGQLAVGSGTTARNGKSSAGRYQPLILDHEIVSLPSASTLAVIRRETEGRKPAEKAVAVLADPVFDKGDSRVTSASYATEKKTDEQNAAPSLSRQLVYDRTKKAAAQAGVAETGLSIPRLPGTRREAERIFSLAPANARLKVVDFEASRATATSAELGQYRYVHFATHGFLNSANPELSGIVLSMVDQQGQPQNGFLLTNEVFNLHLPAELVVLSACQTGLGKEIKGEGLVGLTRGFMYAGAPRVIVSLWSVDDEATSEMMARLYKGLLQEHLRPAAALRAAQIEMWRQRRWQAPYYWAAFTIQGEWR